MRVELRIPQRELNQRPGPIMQTLASRPRPTGLHAGATRSSISDVAEIVALVAEDLALTEAALHSQLKLTIPAVAEIGVYLASAGGKRLRPLLTALGARAVGFQGDIASLSCIGEMLHLGSLLHDDVVDDGLERRGQPAAQRVYGNPAVILTGDFCVARGLQLAAEHGGHTAVTQLAATVASMSEGEVTQLLNAGNLELSQDVYLDIVHKKSATLISWCAAAGAWATEDAPAAQALLDFGESVGAAFQITDDVLDYTGSVNQTGKRRGRDLAERKMTLPLIIALERVPGLRERLQAGDPSPERIPALIESVLGCGAALDALAHARTRIDEGIAALSVLPDTPYRQGLVSLAHKLVERVA
jgi:octaprenyl-diphosphate synthase